MGKGKQSTKPSGKGKPAAPAKSQAPPKRGDSISDALRQAVKDLGGDDSDLDLIAGVDDDEGDAPVSKGKGDDEKSIKAALGEFMKGLDFKAVGGAAVAEDLEEDEDENDEEEESEESESGDEEEDDEEEEDEEVVEEDDSEEAQEDEDEEDEESSEEEAPVKPTEKKAAPKPAPVQSSDTDPKSGRNVPPVSAWWTLVPELPTPSKPLGKAPFDTLNTLRQKAERLLSELPKPNRAGSSSDTAFISQILSSGTHQDKLSALVLLVRESPIHAISDLERLRGMAGWRDGAPHNGGGRDQRMATLRALADWWVTGGGKETGKLRYFADQPLLAHPEITDRHLVVYAFEDFLKKWFFNVLQIAEVLSHDTLPYVRTKALDVMFQLLSGNAEQEQNLLRLGVNKLGDSDRTVAAKTSHHILQLLQVHPAMKAVVAREISAIVLKTSLTGAAGSSNSGAHIKFDDSKDDKKEKEKDANTHGRYYGLITLNQMTLTSKDKDVAGRLVEVYFEVFREILGEEQAKGDDESVKGEEIDEKVTGKVEKWRGRRKGAKPKGGRKTAMEDELVDSSEAKLVAAVLTGINRALPFAKIDEALFSNYMETLFKICHAGTFNTSIQALQLIFQVCQARHSVSDRFYRTLYESLFDQRLLTSSKQAMYLNLLFKALKADASLPRVMAFVKRLLQMLGMHQPPFICGALYLLGELFENTPGLRRMLIEPEDDGEEHFVDADKKQPAAKPEGESSAPSTAYDGKKREPLYAHADSSCLWELMPFLNHFHPSVSLQATQLLMGQPLTGSPDISLNTLISFLDKFVYRNPKKTVQPKGASIMQPAAVTEQSGVVRSRGPRTDESAYVNSEAFWRKKVEDVPVDQLFFHKFFSTKLAKKEASKKKRRDESDDESDMGADSAPELPSDIADETDEEGEGEGEDDEMADSDPEEAEVWKAMQASMPDAGDDMGISDDSSDEDIDVDYSSDEEEGGEEKEDEDEEDEDEEDEEDEDEEGADSDSDSDGFPSFDDDEDDLIPLDEMPEVALDESEPEPEEEEDAEAGAKRKRREERKERKKKRREMPAFASYEDYAALIEQDGDSE